ncbi:MAG: rod shape-determining protein RodA [Bacteroidota bacterium]
MSSRENIQVDWLIILLYVLLVITGWLNIYAANYDPVDTTPLFSLEGEAGKQLLFIGGCIVIITTLLVLDYTFYDSFAYIFYFLFIVLLLLVLVVGNKIGGARSWFQLGIFKLQPSEFAKFATALALAKYMGTTPGFRFDKLTNLAIAVAIVAVPTGLILLQPDAGTVLVFTSFIIAFYREGLTPVVIWIGLAAIALFIITLVVSEMYFLFIGVAVVVGIICFFVIRKQGVNRTVALIVGIGLVVSGYILSVDYLFNEALLPHQQTRILLTLNMIEDPSGGGYNLFQAKTSISSGGLWGKGWLAGDRTQTDWVPEQSTDFIFTTLAEEHGWVGSALVVVIFTVFLWRLIMLAERQKSRFSRIFGYGVFGIFFFHILINIGMTMGLFPVVGIPLPFYSYGGSSLWSFTILLFMLIKLDAHRGQVLMR